MLTLNLTHRGVDDPPEPRQVEITTNKVVLGRASHCDVVLEGREWGASSEHARIEKLGNTYYLFDQGSTNGTALNGTRIRPHTSVPLANNDKIYLGRWLISCSVRVPTARHWVTGKIEDPRARMLLDDLREQADAPEKLLPVLKELIDGVDSHERLNLLRQVELLSESSLEKTAVAAEIDRREGLREAALVTLTSLSAHHTGGEVFEDAEQVMRFFRLADQSLEMMLEWIVGCISSRRAFEDKFSAKVTRFFGMDANPVKHALTPQQIGRFLMNWEAERDAEKIKRNLEEALRDLTSHQLALVGGVQTALKTALLQLDPDALQEQAGGGLFRRGKAWEHFKKTFKDLLENDTKLYNEVIYPSLRQGYLEAHEHLHVETEVATPVPAELDDGTDGTYILHSDTSP